MLFHHPLEICSPGAGLQSPAGWKARGGMWGLGKRKEDHQHEDIPKLSGSSQQNRMAEGGHLRATCRQGKG